MKVNLISQGIWFVSHSKAPLNPVFLTTAHMNNSTGSPFNLSSFWVPKVVLVVIPKYSRNSSSETAPYLSILLPKITTGIFPMDSLLIT